MKEAIWDDRTHGYLQAKMQPVGSDTVWLHWGSDAAGWLRGVKHSKCGFKLVGKGRVVAQSPSNLRCVLLFEGKDSYDNYLEYLGPFNSRSLLGWLRRASRWTILSTASSRHWALTMF